jgi:hypothetical protein
MQRTAEDKENAFSTILSPYNPAVKGRKTGKVNLKALAQALALIEGSWAK